MTDEWMERALRAEAALTECEAHAAMERGTHLVTFHGYQVLTQRLTDQRDVARADADALRTYARHDPMCAYRPSYPDGPVATCDCGFDAALAAHDAHE